MRTGKYSGLDALSYPLVPYLSHWTTDVLFMLYEMSICVCVTVSVEGSYHAHVGNAYDCEGDIMHRLNL